MESNWSVVASVFQGVSLASINIKDAHLSTSPKFSVFCNKGPLLSVCGTAVQPVHCRQSIHQGFSVLGLLHTHGKGIPIIRYLDNLILREHSASLLETNVSHRVHTRERFAWVQDLQKSALIPTQMLAYLVLTLDTIQARVILYLTLYEGSGKDSCFL